MEKYENPNQIEKLLLDLQSKDKWVRIKSAQELGKIDTSQEQMTSKVLDSLKVVAEGDPDKFARDIAKKSIRNITDPQSKDLEEHWKN